MALFDRLVDQALINQKEYSTLRMVIEKELFHHDILRIMSGAGLLQTLTFIGGTCLRDCYGSNRLSEDLDFTGGTEFNKETLSRLADILEQSLIRKYGFPVEISEPIKEHGNVDTWKIKIQTRPKNAYLPSQKIHIDICALTSYEREPQMLLNHYGVDMGTGGLIIQAQSQREILADKFLALGLRPNRIKNRDLWDIIWLSQLKIKLSGKLIKLKLVDHNVEMNFYIEKMDLRIASILNDPMVYVGFKKEMSRFLPFHIVQETVESPDFWVYLSNTIMENWRNLKTRLTENRSNSEFMM
jgi:predicted nucleotidyltransferase component of viral defense system